MTRLARQSRVMSLVEAIANVLVGFVLAVLTQITLFPMLELQVSVADNLLIGMIFTAVSIVRSFALRRLFEAIRARSEKTALASGSCAMSAKWGKSDEICSG